MGFHVQVGACVLLLAPIASSQCEPRYPLQQYSVGNSPGAPVAADLDGDGQVDFAVACFDDGLWVALGSPKGELLPSASVATAPKSRTVALGDLDGDGAPDAVVISASKTVTVHRNVHAAGSGAVFGAGSGFGAGALPLGIAIADLDLDGFNDAIVVTQETSSVIALPGAGDGSLLPPISSSTGPGPGGVVIADFDADGVPDAVTAQLSGPWLSFLKGNGDFSFQVPAPAFAGVTTDALAASDVDGDGRLDLVAGGSHADSHAVRLRNQGGGIFGPAKALATTGFVTAIGTADFDVDGRKDIAFVAYSPSTVKLFRGSGSGFVEGATFGVPELPAGAAVAMIDGDPFPDLVFAHGLGNGRDGFLVVCSGSGAGGFALPTLAKSDATPERGRMADLDLDGTMDAVVAEIGPFGLRTALGNGDATFAMQPAVPLASICRDLAVTDWNGDGLLDVAAATYAIGQISLIQNAGGGAFVAAGAVAAKPTQLSIEAGDLDGDGLSDLVIGALEGADAHFHTAGSSFGPGQPLLANIQCLQARVADLDLDGDLDVVIVGKSSGIGFLASLANQGNGTFANVFAGAPAGSGLRLTDWTGDGAPDLVAYSATAANIAVGLGNGAFAPLQTIAVSHWIRDCAAGDLDGDGAIDLVVDDAEIGSLELFEPDGAGGFVATKRLCPTYNAVSIEVADLDADGKEEVAVFGGNAIAAYVERSAASAVLYGAGKAGSLGVPLLASSAPALGATVTLDVTNGLPGALPFVVFGTSATSIAFDGGTLLVAPLLVVPLATFDAAGGSSVAFSIPAVLELCGSSFNLQTMFVDPAASGAYHTAQSRGLCWTFGS